MSEYLPETLFFGGRLKDRKALYMSSSGGIFTALSDVILDREGAIACSTYNYEMYQQEFRLLTTSEERDKARGSKYVQSVPGNIFKEAEQWLKTNIGRELLFVGTGCQAAGFRSYAESKGFRDHVIIVDLICHGVPTENTIFFDNAWRCAA